MMLTPKIEAERLTCTDRFSFLFFLLVGDKNKNSLYSIILFIIWILLYQTDRDCGEKKKKKKKVWVHCTASGVVGRREIEHIQA